MGIHPLAFVHPTVVIGPSSVVWQFATILEGTKIGEGCVVGAGTVINRHCLIGNHVRIQSLCQIVDRMIIEDDVLIGGGTQFTDDDFGKPGMIQYDPKPPYVEQGARIGASATVLPGVRIGRDSIVGAGSVVTRNVPPYRLVMGSPAQIIEEN